ncbi:MAG: serine hydrolase [Planctomycetia bacterium]|nr:serine hydrolase [Planctomycetia bacterium]
MTNDINKLWKRLVSSCGLLVLLGTSSINLAAQEVERQDATSGKTTSIERAQCDEDLNAAMEKYLQSAKDKKLNIQSVMVLQHGKVLYEKWLNGGEPQKAHVLNSVSKTFTSAAVGLAISEGLLSLDDKVVSFFPDDLPDSPSENLKNVTVRNLLTMNSGHDSEPKRDAAETWTKSFLAWPIDHQPGAYYCYNSLGTYMLSAIVQKVTGQKVVDYLQPRLFDPLGIDAPRWDESPQGINCGGWGLYLKTEDLAKMGLLLLQGGKWNGKQILPAEYVAEATRAQVPCQPSWIRADKVAESGLTPENSDWVLGYGYQVWMCRHNAYRADGAGGQYIIVIPDKDAVVINTADLQDMQAELNLVWDYILPSLK